MAKLVQDEAGNIFSDEGGGVLTPVTEAQARAMTEHGGAGDALVRSANLALTNMGTAGMSLLSDDPRWEQLNKLGHEEAQALQLAQPMLGGLGSLLPQIAAGVATAGAGPLAAGATEAALGGLSAPEGSRGTAALIGGALGAGGALLPDALALGGDAYRKGRQRFNTSSLPDDDLLPGELRPDYRGFEEPIQPGAAEAPPPAPAAPAGTLTDLAADMSGPSLQARPGGATAMDAVGDLPLPASRNLPGAPADPGPSMAQKQMAVLQREGAAGAQEVDHVRVTGDLLLPSELRRYGVPVTDAQRRYLTMSTKEGQSAIEGVRKAMAQEDLMGSIPVLGKDISDAKAMQRTAATNFVNAEFGIPRNAALTDGTVSQRMQVIGDDLDKIANEMGGVYIAPEMRTELENVVEHATGSHQGLIRKHVENALRLADQNGGALNGQDWQWLRTQLNDTIERGVKKGDEKMISDTASIMNTLTEAMEQGLPDGLKLDLRKLRKQYAIGATLHKAGVRDPDGIINPTTFYNRWKSPQGLKWKGKDDVGQFMATLAFLTSKRAGDSGTAPRVLNALKEGAMSLIPGGNAASVARALVK